MSSKYMKIKKIVIPMMTFILLASQLVGCATFKPAEMVEAINRGESIVLEVAEPTYEIQIKGEQIQDVTWIQLDQLKTFNDGFRQTFDKAFNITIVSEDGKSGKSGCMFVNPLGERDGNTTLSDSFRNKTFMTKYWSDHKVQNEIVKVASDAYTDISSDKEAVAASINAYYNLINDAKNPDSFNGSQSMTRESFYTLMYKANNPVSELSVTEQFSNAVGGETEYIKYVEQLAEKGFLKASNKSLDSSNISGNITRAEAVYMVVNALFPDELAKVTDKDKAYTDTRNAGDLALKCGFKELVKVDGQKEKKLVEKDKWQAYSLAYSLQNPDKGIQNDLYKALVVAKQLELLDGSESRWDESISKSESIYLLINAFKAQNGLYGYLTEVEHGKINPNNFIAEESITAPIEEKVEVDETTGIEHGTDDQGRPVAKDSYQTLMEKEIASLLEDAPISDVTSSDVERNTNEKGEFEFKPETPSSKPTTPPASSKPIAPAYNGYRPAGEKSGEMHADDNIKGGSTTDGGTKWN